MIPAPLLLAWRYRKPAGIALAAVAVVGVVWWQIDSYGDRREDAGRAAVKALWEADTKSRDTADAKIVADNLARVEAAKANNVEVMEDANAKLLAIAADRDSLAGRMRDYQDRLRTLAAAQATDHTLADVAARVASRQREIDAAFDAYDGACRRDAVRFDALQREVAAQM